MSEPPAEPLAKGPSPGRASSFRSGMVGRALVLLVLAAIAWMALARPRQDFDLMAYVGVVHAYDAPSDEAARERTVADLRRELSDERFAWMVGRDYPNGYAHAMAFEPRSFAQQLVWFRGRPLFTRSAWIVSKLGVPVPRALHLVALVSTLALALVFFWGTRAPSDAPAPRGHEAFRFCVWLAIGAIFHLDELAASPLSDPLSSALVVGGLLLVLTPALPRRAPCVGLGVLVVSVLARSDNAMYVAALALFTIVLALQKKNLGISPRILVFATLAAFALRAWVERGSYGWAALVHFRRVHFETYPADVRATLDASTYLGIVRTWSIEVYACEVLALVGVALLFAHPRLRARTSDPFVAFAIAMLPLAVVRFFAFPDWDSRFFVAPLGLFFLGLARAIVLARTSASPEPHVPETRGGVPSPR